jgi:diguanylate cyclase (GGDEF)-like protein/PAS domain S-box-containing protein
VATRAPYEFAVDEPITTLHWTRWAVRVFVYAGVTGLVVFDHYVHGFSWETAFLQRIGGYIIAALAIEVTFAYVFRLRRRGAYPNNLLLAFSQANDLEDALERGLECATGLLGADGALVALEENGALKLQACHGLSGDEAARLWETVKQKAGPGGGGGTTLCVDNRRVVLIPLRPGERPGVLAVAGGRQGDMNDGLLLQNISLAFALSIERVSYTEMLRASEKRFRALIEHASDFILVLDSSARVKYVSPSVERILGYQPEEVLDRQVFEFMDPDELPALQETFRLRLQYNGVGDPIELRIRDKQGEWRIIEAIGNFDRAGDPAVGGVVFNGRDVTGRRRTEQELRESEERFRSLFNGAGDVVYTISLDGRLTSLNPAFETVTGWRVDEWLGKHFAPLLHPDDLPEAAAALERVRQRDRTLPETFEWRIKKRSGEYMTGEFVPRPLIQASQLAGVLGIVRDVTLRRQQEEAIRYLADHDPLTGVMNRTALLRAIEERLGDRRQGEFSLAVFFLDLDCFKLVNDSLGHSAGDEVLREVGGQLRAMLREDDLIGRIGGDEFILAGRVRGIDEACEVAGRILAGIQEERRVCGRALRLTASIGIAVYPAHGQTAEELITRADTAMYRAKQEGRDSFCVYTTGIDARPSGMPAAERA